VLTNRYDNARSGANTSETILDTTSVASAKFGKLFSQTISGSVYGQPLYAAGVMVNGAAHNVVYVATAQNMVYAFDADTMQAPIWTKQLETPVPTGAVGGGCGDMVTNVVGITSTPVISLDENKIYVVARTNGANNLHALDLATGADGAGSPAAIGTGTAGYTANSQLNRPGLLLLNGVVYAGFGSNCDSGGYHGFIFGHDAHTLAQKSAFNVTPTGTKGAIWQSGMGLASDGTSIWFAAGNGTSGPMDLGMNVASVTPAGGNLMIGQHHAMPAQGDNDLCSGPVLVGNQVLAGGKSGYLLLFNQTDASLATNIGIGGEVHNMAAWNGGAAGQFVYTWGDGTALQELIITGGMLMAKGTNTEQKPGHPGGMITVSSNGTMPGTGIVWALLPLCGNAWKATCPGALYAWDATDVTKKSLWNSTINAADAPGEYAKYSPPTVANGKVYVATWSGNLEVYGLKP
jgi:outer membrane protein assembly factor BamB